MKVQQRAELEKILTQESLTVTVESKEEFNEGLIRLALIKAAELLNTLNVGNPRGAILSRLAYGTLDPMSIEENQDIYVHGIHVLRGNMPESVRMVTGGQVITFGLVYTPGGHLIKLNFKQLI